MDPFRPKESQLKTTLDKSMWLYPNALMHFPSPIRDYTDSCNLVVHASILAIIHLVQDASLHAFMG